MGLDRADYGTHSMRRTKATLIHRRTKNLSAANCSSATPGWSRRCGTSASMSMALSRCRAERDLMGPQRPHLPSCRNLRQLHTDFLPTSPSVGGRESSRNAPGAARQPARWCVAPNVVAKIANPVPRSNVRAMAPNPARLVRMADSHAFRCELAFLLTASEREHRNERAGSRTCEEHRAFHFETWTGGKARASARSGSHVAGARRRPCRLPRGGRHDAAGCRDRMPSTKSVASRLESGVYTRPTLTTIEKYARAVGAIVEIRVRTRR